MESNSNGDDSDNDMLYTEHRTQHDIMNTCLFVYLISERNISNSIHNNFNTTSQCHEIGHGFGLPHRDEIANNADLGSCLDYTYRFENNKRPDTVVDFENLKLLYGTVDGTPNNRIRHLRGDASTSTGTRINAQQHESSAEITQSRKWHYKEGRLLHESKHKRIYENHLGGGRRVVTTLLLAKDDQQD